ncbi:hypothetical protein FRB91_000823 [Serendipita sp. 411]|nr:hypothetical protein FRB91_000823 [Serendipita sp. 411]
MAEYEKTSHSLTTDNANADFLSKDDIETQRSNEDSHGTDTPKRIFGLRWWKRRSNRIIPAGLWPRVVYCMIGIVCLSIWLAFMLAISDSGHPLEQSNHLSHIVNTNSDSPERDYILLQGSLINFDMEKRILTISWVGYPSTYYGNGQFGDIYDPDSPKVRDGIEIYRDVSSERYNVTYTSGADNETHWQWTYQIDNRTAKPIGVIGMHPWDGFDTDIMFTQKEGRGGWRQPLLGYPFDEWHGEVVLVANNVTLSNRFNVNGTGVIEIADIGITDRALNWRIAPEINNTCLGTDPAATIDLGTLDGNTLPPSCHLKIEFEATRPLVVIICAITAVIVNWTCTIFIFIITCETVFMRRGYMLQGMDILSMCFTALFALPTIRSLLPGAPAYGAKIDLIGILPCTLIVALCTVCISVSKLKIRRTTQKEE